MREDMSRIWNEWEVRVLDLITDWLYAHRYEGRRDAIASRLQCRIGIESDDALLGVYHQLMDDFNVSRDDRRELAHLFFSDAP